MRRSRIIVAACIALVLLVAAGLVAPAMWAEQMYPHAPTMPPVVATSAEDLLSQYETFLKSKAPAVVAALQPGLTDSQIDGIEQKYNLKLPADLRALYRWRNGMPSTATVEAFPNHQFVPLDIALATRDNDRRQVKAITLIQRLAYTVFAGHRDAWVGIIVDAAGDGHFFDPNRTESQGSFFFNFNEDGRYLFYPAFRNYLAAVLDGCNSGVFIASPQGVDTADFLKAQQLWEHYGAIATR